LGKHNTCFAYLQKSNLFSKSEVLQAMWLSHKFALCSGCILKKEAFLS